MWCDLSLCQIFMMKLYKRPDDYIYALMSNDVYRGDQLQAGYKLLENEDWEIYKIKAGKLNYFGVIYINHQINHIVLAHRGTDSIKALIENLYGIFLNKISLQKKEAFSLVKEAVQLAKEHCCGLSFTGHSLGAFLAELSVFYCKGELEFPNINAVTFESPGSVDSLKTMQSNLKLYTIVLDDLDIVEYVSYPNLINTCNHHVGTLYMVSSDLGKHGQLPVWSRLKEVHSMEGIIEVFNKNSRPMELRCLKDWPIGKQRKYFFELFELENWFILSEEDIIASSEQHFKMVYESHYKIDNFLSRHNVLPLKHFDMELQKFLELFYKWQKDICSNETKNRGLIIEKLRKIKVNENIINYLLEYELANHNRIRVIGLHASSNIVIFRKELSVALEKHGKDIRELCKTQQKITTGQEKITLNLPKRNNKFIGREYELIQIRNQLNNQKIGAAILCEIVGLGGIGKTQLATEFAYSAFEKRYYKAIFWVMAETANTMLSSYKKFANYLQLGNEGLNFNELKEIVHNELAIKYKGSKILFILDNAMSFKGVESYLKSLCEELTPYIAPYPHTLITSRSQHGWPETPLSLNAFTSQEALMFIKKHLPNANNAAIINLAEVLNYFPLALSQAVAYIKNHTNIEDYLEAYAIKPEYYLNDFSDNCDEYAETLWNTWNITLTKLSDNGQKIMFISAYIDPDDIPIEFFGNLTNVARMEAIKDLRQHSLIMLTNSNKAFKVHRLLQEVIRLTIKSKFKGLVRYDWLSDAMYLIENKFDFNYLDFKKWNSWEKYLNHAHFIAKHVVNAKGELFDRGIKLYAKVTMFMTHAAVINDAEEISEMWLKLLELAKNYKQTDSLLSASINTYIGIMRKFSNRFDEAKLWYDKAIAIYKQEHTTITQQEKELLNILRLIPLSNDVNLAEEAEYNLIYTLTRLGNLFYDSFAQPINAIKNYNKALKSCSKIEKVDLMKDPIKYHKIDILRHKVKVYIHVGKLYLAEKVFKTEKLLLNQQHKDHRQKALVYSTLAQLYNHIGRFQESKQLFKDALDNLYEIFSKNHFRINTIKVYASYNSYMLGDIEFANTLLKSLKGAIVCLDDRVSNSYWHWFPKLLLARIYEFIGEYDKSLGFIKESFLIAKQQYKEKLHDSVAFQLSRAENWIMSNEDKDTSVLFWKSMLEVNIQLFGEKHYQAARYHQLYGQALYNMLDFKTAMEHYKEAKIILEEEEIKHPDLSKFNRQNLQTLQQLINRVLQ